MGYGTGALQQLIQQLSGIRSYGSVLELGAQDINQDVLDDALLSTLIATHGGDVERAEQAALQLPSKRPMRAAELFRGSTYRYHSLDLFEADEFIINADLNLWCVPEEDRGTYDLITNQGTTEHVADQINCFRVIHDYAAPGALMIHNVPFSGYFNHGLFNYHPTFFIFLAHANGYSIRGLGLSAPHLPFTIPQVEGIYAPAWSDVIVQSGIVSCQLQKMDDAPFKLFTDFDQATLGRMELPPPWDQIIRERYDLRVRDR